MFILKLFTGPRVFLADAGANMGMFAWFRSVYAFFEGINSGINLNRLLHKEVLGVLLLGCYLSYEYGKQTVVSG